MKILDENFIKKNKDKAKILYKNKIYELKEYFEDIDENYNHKDLIKLKIIFIHNIIDMSYMFYKCYTLITLSDKDKISNMKKIYITKSYKSLISIDDYQMNNKLDGIDKESISLSDKSETNQSYLNNNSNSNEISSISEASEQKSTNLFSYKENFQFSFPLSFIRITNMNSMFYGCKSLISLPDISKWNTSNVNDMSRMFYLCNSLISLPDISKWNTSNVNNMSEMFDGCNSLISLPDISKWNTSNVNNMSNMFYEF